MKPQPPAVLITAGLDPLCDEGLAYRKKLSNFTEVVHQHESSQIHGFITLTGVLPGADRAVSKICRTIKTQLRRHTRTQR